MADDNLDEDLFADLYDGDDVAPPKVEDAKPEPTVAPVVASHPPQQEPLQQPEALAAPIAASSDYSMANVENGDSGANGTQQWNDGGQNLDSHDDNYGPIGIKEDGKMFIGGLNWETTDESLRNYFSEFGEVHECTVMRDGATGRSRGFGFLTFKDPKTVNTVMVKEHYLDGKIIDPKRAIPREEQEKTAKIFVGGVSQEATERDFKDFFMQFGRVIDATLMMDKDTGRPRGFGFVTFDGDEAVDRCLAQPLEIHGKPIEVKRAQPRGNMQDEDRGGRFNRRDKFGRGGENQQGNQNLDQQQQQGSMTQQGISPATMAQYWARMQQYFAMMQQQLATNMASQAQMNPMAAMGGQMNPAMMQQMQQMMAMQQAQQQQQQQNMGQSPNGTPNPQSPGSQNAMNPQMMQQMQQMMAMQQQGGGGGGGGGSGSNSGGGGGGNDGPQAGSPVNGGGFNSPAPTGPRNALEQNMFEQQKYEHQQQQRMQQNQQYAQAYSGGGPGAWEGMYDDVPPPNQGGGGNFQRGGGGGGGFRGRGRGGGGHGGHGGTPPTGPSNAPANAPTGPKNAGKPFANYRGGGRGGNRGWRPY